MNGAGLQYAALGALIGWFTASAKKRRPMKAVLWGAGAFLLATQVAPRVGVTLPRLGA